MGLRYFPAARDDVRNVIRWSRQNFGDLAAQRYRRLISVALSDIEANPLLAHSYELKGLQSSVRLYHLKHSSDRAAIDGRLVKKPRHFIAYQSEDIPVIVRLLHERMQIVDHLKDTLG